jgi:hypothetical protein
MLSQVANRSASAIYPTHAEARIPGIALTGSGATRICCSLRETLAA